VLDPEDEGTMILLKVRKYSQSDASSQLQDSRIIRNTTVRNSKLRTTDYS